MKISLSVASIIFALLGLCSGCAKKELSWFQPDPGEKIEFAITLQSGEKHEFDVRSDKPLQLRLSTNASYELMEKHSADWRDPPVRLAHRKRIEALATTKGVGGVLFIPEAGSIPLRLSNATAETLEIIVSSVPIAK